MRCSYDIPLKACRWCEERGKDIPITYGELWRNTRQVIYILVKKLKLSRVRSTSKKKRKRASVLTVSHRAIEWCYCSNRAWSLCMYERRGARLPDPMRLGDPWVLWRGDGSCPDVPSAECPKRRTEDHEGARQLQAQVRIHLLQCSNLFTFKTLS